MKLTREKIVYFVGGVVVALIFILPLRFIVSSAHNHFNVNAFYRGIFFDFIIILLTGTLAFVYTYKKRENYNIYFCSFLTALTPILTYLFMELFYFDNIIEGLLDFSLLMFFMSIYLLCYVFSLIVLGITNPLRKKIKW